MADASITSDATPGIDPLPAALRRQRALPKTLSPKVLAAIRMVAGGASRTAAAKAHGLRPEYLRRVTASPMGRAELTRITAAVETVAIEHMASPAGAGSPTSRMSEASLEVEDAVVEAIRKLRNIMRSSRSDMAVANAAKQILELAQAGKRMAAAQAPEEEGVPLSGEDQALLTAVIADLRLMNATGAPASPEPPSAPLTPSGSAVEPPAPGAFDTGTAAPTDGMDNSANLPPAWDQGTVDDITNQTT